METGENTTLRESKRGILLDEAETASVVLMDDERNTSSEHWYNESDWREPKNLKKTCPSIITVYTPNLTKNGPGPNSGLQSNRLVTNSLRHSIPELIYQWKTAPFD